MTTSHSPEETLRCGRELAETLRPGDVIALTGELGAGKTCLVKGIAAGLGVAQPVTSPSYTLIHEYPGGRIPLVHIDLYRLDTAQDALNIGIEEHLGGTGVTIIEWAEKIEPLLPPHVRRIRLTALDETTRLIEST